MGHENLGPLSGAAGFTPATPPLEELPPSHAVWDELARELPELYTGLGLRERLETTPRLSAEPDALPDRHLQRAATVLGILVHAYHRVEPRHGTPTPDSVLVPWQRICERLGRKSSFLSYLDLIVCNWRLLHPDSPRPLLVEETRLLVPTVGTDEEQFFYLTQLEMLSRGAPLVSAAAHAGEAVARGDAEALAGELALMADCVAAITRKGLPKIEPRTGKRFHVDPVVWAKTVAPLAVPLVEHGIGPSGTASPMFHLLDSVIGRTRYRSFIGDEAQRLRDNYPRFWREFIQSVAGLDIASFAGAAGHPPLAEALADLRRVYAGGNGLLGRHRLKVSGYLNTSYRVGRDVTISGFPAAARVGEELAASRAERPVEEPAAAPPGPAPSRRAPGAPAAPAAPPRTVTPSELLRHPQGAEREWLSADDAVYDVTDFLRRHPGGRAPVASYLGTDAGWIFRHLGHDKDPTVRVALRTLRVGRLRRPAHLLSDPGSPELRTPLITAYNTWLTWAVELTQRANALTTDLSIRDSRTTMTSKAGDLTPYTLQFAIEAHERFQARTYADVLGPCLTELHGTALGPDPEPHDAPVASAAHLYRALEHARVQTRPSHLAEVETLRQAVVAVDRRFLDTVRTTLVDALQALESRPALTPPGLSALLLTHLSTVHRAARSYRSALAGLFPQQR
ncbi:hypothetical protein DEJ50_06420 [Streptomyces venezuelae]|uniref:Cytochrome b5 heme-binding domain-containing protein n=1 Tax=Streptomyces venezuelae TaxID=54571 RepID=A0A5P2CXC7_STRVZ|nr:cytochrome b5 domain-containing protein [Streptomyces venezuelae]QES47515.1 hypothetical protein DEJ50_06420 [Streptomyces venezuelae]